MGKNDQQYIMRITNVNAITAHIIGSSVVGRRHLVGGVVRQVPGRAHGRIEKFE